MRALTLKELREVFGITAIALAAYLALVINLMGAKVFDWVPGMPAGTTGVPFVDGDFTGFFVLISVAFAIALGFRQSAWESGKGTFLFLLHRPASRDTIFLTKLVAGAGVLVLCACLPITLYGWWASVPNHHPSPFEWAMTASAWRLALQMPLLYLRRLSERPAAGPVAGHAAHAAGRHWAGDGHAQRAAVVVAPRAAHPFGAACAAGGKRMFRGTGPGFLVNGVKLS